MAKTPVSGMQRYATLFYILFGVVVLALIVVSAFAYQWHTENADLKAKNQTLRALTDQSTLDSVTSELTDTQQSLYEVKTDNEQLSRMVQEYEKILSENNLLPTSAPTETAAN